VKAVGLCHGVHMGRGQIAHILGLDVDDLDTAACGINHFTWFQRIRDRRTGEDLYPRLREAEREGDWLSDWHEIGMSRILFRLYGLWPSPATNHFGEYIRWAEEFYAGEMQFFYDPADGAPWESGKTPEFVYSLSGDVAGRTFHPEPQKPERLEDHPLQPSGEAAIPIIEALVCGVSHDLLAVNVPNHGAIPNLPSDGVVEVPAKASRRGVKPVKMDPLPEPIAAMLRTQLSIQKLIVEAFAEGSKTKLVQAVLLEPTVDSYCRAVEMVDEMIRLQKGMLPEME
jgi:alpha-galactosidase